MDSYFKSLLKYCYRKNENSKCKTKFVYTAMHGVGYPFMKAAFEAFGFPELIPVKEQV